MNQQQGKPLDQIYNRVAQEPLDQTYRHVCTHFDALSMPIPNMDTILNNSEICENKMGYLLQSTAMRMEIYKYKIVN